MGSKKQFEVCDYQDWMLEQIVSLNIDQYGGNREERRQAFLEISSSKYIKNRSVPMVALDKNEVVGVQTYRYWPYYYLGRKFYSLQSGGTLVKKTHRGQGLFMKMLSRGNALLEKKKVDFVMGFPVPMSYGGFIKDGWSHLFSPVWFVKVLRPKNVLKKRYVKRNKEEEDLGSVGLELGYEVCENLRRYLSDGLISLSSENDFREYRYKNNQSEKYLFWSYKERNLSVVFLCKISWDRGFKELLIGDVLCNADNNKLVIRGFSAFVNSIRRIEELAAITILVGGKTIDWLPVLIGNGFLPIPKRISFILKKVGLNKEEFGTIENWRKWSIMQADLDTW